VNSNGSWGYIDRSGEMVIPPMYRQGGTFKNGLALVIAAGKWAYIDQQGHPVWVENIR
jgi:WG containing repeat